MFLNTLLFLIISGLGFYYLFQNPIRRLKDPFVKQKPLVVSGRQYLLLFILGTGILACGQHMANRLLVIILISFLALFIDKNKIQFNLTAVLYVLFLIWLIIAIFYSPVKSFGLRVFLKYLLPFLIMLFASKVTQSGVFYLKAVQVILYMALFAMLSMLVLPRIPFVGSVLGLVLFYGPAIIDFFPVGIAISLVYYSYFKKIKYLIYTALFIVPCLLGVIRTGILASGITIIVFAVTRYRIRALPYVSVGLAVLVGSVLYIPAVRQKMFVKQMSRDQIIERSDELSKKDIESNGRFAMWEWSMELFYKDKELTGSGLGVLQERFYSLNHPFGSIRIVHNDYVQLLCDTGLVGLILYISIFVSLIVHAIFVYFRSKIWIVKLAAIIAGVSLGGMVSTLYTDNVVNYTLMTLAYPFALYGMFLGLNAHYKNKLQT